MAVTKRFIFSDARQLTADFGKSIGHPARVTMLSRLAEGGVVSFQSLIAGIELSPSTVYDHIEKLERVGLVHRALMADNKAGYELNHSLYRRMLNATRNQLNATALVMEMYTADDWSGVAVSGEWVGG